MSAHYHVVNFVVLLSCAPVLYFAACIVHHVDEVYHLNITLWPDVGSVAGWYRRIITRRVRVLDLFGGLEWGSSGSCTSKEPAASSYVSFVFGLCWDQFNFDDIVTHGRCLPYFLHIVHSIQVVLHEEFRCVELRACSDQSESLPPTDACQDPIDIIDTIYNLCPPGLTDMEPFSSSTSSWYKSQPLQVILASNSIPMVSRRYSTARHPDAYDSILLLRWSSIERAYHGTRCPEWGRLVANWEENSTTLGPYMVQE